MASRCLKSKRSAESRRFQAMAQECKTRFVLEWFAGRHRKTFGSRMVSKSRWWRDLTTVDFADLDPERTVAALPVAAVEQHGAHLPVGVDATINEGIVARAVAMMPDRLHALVLPMTTVGKSDEH